MSAALSSEAAAPDSSSRVETAAFVLGLRARGISDLPLLRAMETVPREIFAPRRYSDLARQDVALPLACGETMSSPTAVALMLSALAVRPGHRVYEVGTGSGYVTALLARMGATLCSVERRHMLAESAWYRLRAAGVAGQCDLDCRDGLGSDEPGLRFDRILLNGAVSAIPEATTSRLAAGGRLVAGLSGEGGTTSLLVIDRDADGNLVRRSGSLLRLSRLFVNAASPAATEV